MGWLFLANAMIDRRFGELRLIFFLFRFEGPGEGCGAICGGACGRVKRLSGTRVDKR